MTTTVIESTNNNNIEIDKYEKEESYYKGKKSASGQLFKRIKSPKEIVYYNWLSQIKDPVTGEYYTGPEGEQPRHLVTTIVRYKDINDKEYLYTVGERKGFDSFKDPKVISSHRPEVHQKTIFKYRTDIDKRTRQITRITEGPQSVEDVYDMPFNEENANKLWKLKKDRTIQLVVKDGRTDEPHAVENKGLFANHNIDKLFEEFKRRDFEYLYNWEYEKGFKEGEGPKTEPGPYKK